jgi:hypothetical protein
LIDEEPKHACETSTTHRETAQQKALEGTIARSKTPRQKYPDTDLEPSVESANFRQGTRSGRELGLRRKDSRRYKAANASEENKRGQDREQDSIERHLRSLYALAV